MGKIINFMLHGLYQNKSTFEEKKDMQNKKIKGLKLKSGPLLTLASLKVE